MSPATGKPDITLRALEIFQICAREGSFQAASQQTGLSLSTVSHHMKNLSEHLGVELFNHARRPAVLTPTGEAFLRNIEEPLTGIRKAKAEISAVSGAKTAYLRVGAIEDFDSDVTPDLAVYLSRVMPDCEFSYHTNNSQRLQKMLRDRELEIGLTTALVDHAADLVEFPLLRDPFVVVLPKHADVTPAEALAGSATLPFLRFTSKLLVARSIEAQLKRLGISLPFRFQSDNNQTLMAMVADGAGWTITTPLMISRARRFYDNVQIHEFPGRRFARKLSIVTTVDCPTSVCRLARDRVRHSLRTRAIDPVCSFAPWLTGEFTLLG